MPADLDASYRLQAAVAGELGDICGWKISALTEAAQQGARVACPIAAPLLAPWCLEAPATLPFATLIAPKIECEFAFELAHDLPARETAYSRAEVEAAIGALRIVVEVCDSRVAPGGPVLLELADALNNGAFIIGPAHADWRAVDYANHAIVLDAVAGRRNAARTRAWQRAPDPRRRSGRCAGARGQLRAGPERRLRAGQIVTTGTCTGAVPILEATDLRADFGALGQVHLTLA